MKSSIYFGVFIAGLICLSAAPVSSEEKNEYIPVAGYDYISLASQSVHTAGLGTILLRENSTFSGIYKHGSLSEKLTPGYPEAFHSIDIMLEAHKDKHMVVTSFISESDQPVVGGWATFQAASLYIYQLMETEKLSIALGLGAALGDFGINLEDGRNWPLLPVPYIGINYNSEILEAEFSFVSGPSLTMTIFPEGRFRIATELQIDKYRDWRDFIFDAALHYRFFTEDESTNDVAGIAAGVRNNNFGFTPGGSDIAYEIQHYSLFAELDLSVLKISGGYAFDGHERLGQQLPSESGGGYFLSFQAMYQF